MKGYSIKSSDWESIYPIGSIYMSANSTSPTTLFGGTWTQLKDQFLLCAGSTYSAGSTGGSASTTLSTANMPAHTHTRGTMNITGSFRLTGDSSNAGIDAPATGSGAITPINGVASGSTVANANWNCGLGFDFNASNAWTGETSSVGSGSSFSNMPPYLAVYVWKRTA